MKAVRLHQFGGPEVLKYETNVPVPTPGPGEVLVNAKAVGINPVETYIRAGVYARLPTLPAILGHDNAGIVTKTGPDVTQFKTGDRVFTSKSTTGTYAEYSVSPVANVHPLPNELSFSQGAALPVSYLTAYRALFQRGSAQQGETLLVHGASGGVGVAAVQFARAQGLRIFGTAGTKEGLELVKKAGAHCVFNHREEGYVEKIKQEAGEGGVDLVVENAAHINLGKDLTLLARGGRVLVVGSRGPVEINPRDTMSREAMISGVMLFNSTPKELSEAHAAIQGGISAGWLRPIVGKEFPLEDAAKAHTDVISGSGALGKTVLVIE
jgi:NADPH2:quinone reductase